MGKRWLGTAKVRRRLALGVLSGAAVLGMGAILQPPAPVQGPRNKPTVDSKAPGRSPTQAVPPRRNLPSIELSPEARAWLARSLELTASSRYDEARASCRALIPLTSPAVVASCIAPIDGLTGRYEVARHRLEGALPAAGNLEQQVWFYALLGELAYWNGDLARAEHALGSALALEPGNSRILALHVDLLLDTGRARQALSMLAGQDADDALLLREMIAYQKLGLAEVAAQSAQRLENRFAQARARAEPLPARDEARLYTNLPGHESHALELASAAFNMQQAPWEARILLEAALHAHNPQAAKPASEWLERSDFESPELRLLVTQLGTLR